MATITATELALDFDASPRLIRKFLRDDAAARDIPTPGKGARYAIEKREVKAMRTRFNAWFDSRNASSDDEDSNTESD